ncbi:type III secretion system protein PrgM [Enterococcus faecalis]|uniref:type III secretion system protein PrgM n=2 Tax=Enterococcus faecalis TaxID=1351 RepID=UPI00080C7ECC|nr:type III secretion system protein PrgM [Enterococcus faecalis]ANU71926.1 type III secretion system protein PrgM [Enterococcus faecalis]ASU26625.1 type III secretion system protein PrgM [Enterococcus faecalis]MCO8259812.1 type III secretion system protein PrgM [Enterococcus faecalis]MCP8907853.1 type III secretion system protein PrgM [Enterococcus faecalis]MCP8910877.1 type III secretion system protein PrgM [Enterococcus faecalis]
MSKGSVKELQKRKARVEKELEKAKDRLQAAKELVEKKENENKQLEAEIISALLVENNITFSELTTLLSEKDSDTTY